MQLCNCLPYERGCSLGRIGEGATRSPRHAANVVRMRGQAAGAGTKECGDRRESCARGNHS